jgi:hypothetical protein
MNVNRNILITNGLGPFGGDVIPTEVSLVTTSGSRFVIMDFLNAIPTSSDGNCVAINLEWSPDPSMMTNPFQPSSSYYAVTSSVFSCQSASLSPLTGSQGWSQFINSRWLRAIETPADLGTQYYLRAYQERQNAPIKIYSPAVPVETRAYPAYCGKSYTSSILTPYIVADMDGYNNSGFENKWMNDALANNSASFSGGNPDTSGSTTSLIKAGGPNFDAFRINGSGSISWPNVGNISNVNQVRVGFGMVKGQVNFPFSSNGNNFLVQINADAIATTSSILVTKPSTGQIVGNLNQFGVGLDLRNRYIEIILRLNAPPGPTSAIQVDGEDYTSAQFELPNFGAAGSIVFANPYTINTNAGNSIGSGDYSIIRVMTAQMPYDSTVYHCKYGPVGAASYTP